MKRLAKIELFKEYLKFSVGHFTIFSETERERLHGHNFKVKASIEAEMGNNGLTLDYNIYKNIIYRLCKELDEYFLIPLQSPYLQFEDLGNNQLAIIHDKDKLIFYKKDLKLLPITNTTVEELSWYLLEELKKDPIMQIQSGLNSIEIGISSGDGQIGYSSWTASK